MQPTFKQSALDYLLKRDIKVGKIEGEGESFVFHVAPADRKLVTDDFKAAMEAELDAIVEPSDMGGFSVIIVEANELDENDDSENVKSDEDESVEDTPEIKDESEADVKSDDTVEVVEESGETAKYKMLSETSRPDATGTVQTVPAGTTVELLTSLGENLVKEGLAEKVVE